ncbi:hypothetical protein PIB30_074531 [Stylosanthes scabra]|uniref:Uncharacterized protein n=1 Tax=Stylosanthes scabra TaxID=79078 RepID=A0ABU6VPE0_9FABA|nr:hypothetical protein [Stylosanthes scabra]
MMVWVKGREGRRKTDGVVWDGGEEMVRNGKRKREKKKELTMISVPPFTPVHKFCLVFAIRTLRPPRQNQSLHRLISTTVASRPRLRLHRVHRVFVFVEELHFRILRHQGVAAAAAASDDSKPGKVYESEEAQSRESKDEDEDLNPDLEVKDQSKQNDIENEDGMKILPFEFVALEACLEAACSVLENEAKTLEHEAYPALDKLTSKISTLTLHI